MMPHSLSEAPGWHHVPRAPDEGPGQSQDRTRHPWHPWAGGGAERVWWECCCWHHQHSTGSWKLSRESGTRSRRGWSHTRALSPLPTTLPHSSTMLDVSGMWVPSTGGTPSLSCPGAWPEGPAAAGAWAGGLSTMGELTPVPMAAPRELTCSTVTSAGADGAARSENILFPCKCHQ